MMCPLQKKLLTIVSISLLWAAVVTAAALSHYQIDIRVFPKEQKASGEETIIYSPAFETESLQFHLFWNGAQPGSRFFSEAPEKVQNAIKEGRGDSEIRVESLSVNGEDLPFSQGTDPSVMIVPLSQPLKAGSSNTIRIAFSLKVPQERMARYGYSSVDGVWWFSQWFPKLGVLTGPGQWECEPFSYYREFFSDYSRWSLTVTLPPGYEAVSNLEEAGREAGENVVTMYRGEQCSDIVFGVAPRIFVREKEVKGRLYRAVLFDDDTERSLRILERSIRDIEKMEEWVGVYPYDLFTVVDLATIGPVGSGMEYPLLINTVRSAELETVIDHEIAHQWFYGIIGFNETKEPWLDEGFASYYEMRLGRENEARNVLGITYTPYDIKFTATGLDRSPRESLFAPPDAQEKEKMFSRYYLRFPVYLSLVERLTGTDEMDRFFKTLVSEYAFSHPRTSEVLKVMEESISPRAFLFFKALTEGEMRPDFSLAHDKKRGLRVDASPEGLFPVTLHVARGDTVTAKIFDRPGTWDPGPFSYAYLEELDETPLNNFVVSSLPGRGRDSLIYGGVTLLLLTAGLVLKKKLLWNAGANAFIFLPLFFSLTALAAPLKIFTGEAYGLNSISLFLFSLKEHPPAGFLFLAFALLALKMSFLSLSFYKREKEAYSFFHLLFVDGASLFLIPLLILIMVGIRSTSLLLLFAFVFILSMAEPVKASLLSSCRKSIPWKHILPMSFLVTLFAFLFGLVLSVVFIPLVIRSALSFLILLLILSAGEYGYKLFYVRFYDYLEGKGLHEPA